MPFTPHRYSNLPFTTWITVKSPGALRAGMSEGQPRDDGGRFGSKLTDQAVLLAFETADEPFLTTSEVHEHVTTAAGVEVDQKTVYQRLQRMHDDGLIGKKKTGARSVGWWAEVAPALSPEAAEGVERGREEVAKGETVALEDV
jgi:predicted transcriptional regulator